MLARTRKWGTTTCACVLAMLAPASRAANAAALVWAIDDGEKIKQDASPSKLATGEGNPIWSPGKPIRLFAMKNETVALQVVITTDDAPLGQVTVDLEALSLDGRSDNRARIANAPGAVDPTSYVGRPIERFVEHFVDVPRPSGGRTPGESLGWAPGSGPPPTKWTGRIPDALIPVEVAPSWASYPLSIAPHANGIVWIDVTVARSLPAGVYRGDVVVKTGGMPLATLPVELEIVDATLPDRPVRTMVHYDRRELERRLGPGAIADAAEAHLFHLLHRHRLAPMHSAMTPAEVVRREHALDGSLYTTAARYEGPGEGLGDGVLALGAYGGFGEPDAAKLAAVEAIADVLEEKKLASTTDIFVYAVDEDCTSAYGAKWKSLLAGSRRSSVKKVRVAWTCSEDAAKQPVDIAMRAATFDAADAAKARASGKDVWVYNGRMPQTGSFLTDTAAVGPRVNGWLAAMFDIGRWFYWEATFWFDDNRGGKGAYDPYVTAETFHNADGDWAMGDGVLLYPGIQVEPFAAHSLGMRGVVASFRLKNWRRGVEDAGYYQLARAVDPRAADAVARRLLPVAFSEAKDGRSPSWPEEGKPYFDARRALLAIVTRGAADGGSVGSAAAPAERPAAPRGCGCRGCNQGAASAVVLGLATLLVRRSARRGNRRSAEW